jgi:hypothetical protein
MHRHITTTIVLTMMVLSSGRVPAARGTTEDELQEWMRVQLNERLYDSCRTVKLKREEVEVYRGFAEFINGQRSALTVTVSDRGVTYKFGKFRPAGAEPNAVEFSRSEIIISRQKMEIARLDALCRQAGIDPQAPAVNTARAPAESASERADVQKSVTTPASAPVFTREMYEKIAKGMTCAQVSNLLAGPGEVTSRSSFDGAENEVRVWTNPDDSHICIVFRDGVVLVKTQSGLSHASWQPRQGNTETDDLHDWQLAKPTDGQPVPLDLSLGQWLKEAYETLTKASGAPAQVDVAEESGRIVVTLAYEDGQQIAHHVELYLTCLPLAETGTETNTTLGTKRVCVPAGIRTDGKEAGPAQAWEALATLAGRSPDQK